MVAAPVSVSYHRHNQQQQQAMEFNMLLSSELLPRWLSLLLKEKFFNACVIHEHVKKNEKNIFCIDCCNSICPHCLSPHRTHRLLQIRRYVYHDVLRLDDAEKLMDCTFVQAYTTNSAKVIFLNQRPQTRTCRGAGNACCTCDRGLQEPFLFCSFYCKVRHLMETEGGVSRHLFDCQYLGLPEAYCCEMEEGQMTPPSVLEPHLSSPTSSESCGSYGICSRALACTSSMEFVKKKRSSVVEYTNACFVHDDSTMSMANRRKGTPHRSPLY